MKKIMQYFACLFLVLFGNAYAGAPVTLTMPTIPSSMKTSNTSGSYTFHPITVENGILLTAVGDYYDINHYSHPYVVESIDGKNWSASAVPSSISSMAVSQAIAGGDTKLAFGVDNSVFYYHGTSWAPATSVPINPLVTMTYGNGNFLSVDYSGVFWYSSEGNIWTDAGVKFLNSQSPATAYGNGNYVAISNDDINQNIIIKYTTDVTSPSSWSTKSIPTPSSLYHQRESAIAYGNRGGWLIVGGGDYSPIIYSATNLGDTWTEVVGASHLDRTFTNNYLEAVTYGNGKYVILDGPGDVYTSASGSANTWSKSATTLSNIYISSQGLIYNNTLGLFIAVGYSRNSASINGIYYSADGITWQAAHVNVDGLDISNGIKFRSVAASVN